MSYVSGGLIQAADYNGFVQNNAGANINSIWGVGSGSLGYGQTTTLPTVSSSATITAAQWASLVNLINTVSNQTGAGISTLTPPVAGNVISVISALNSDLTILTADAGNATNQGTQFTGWTGTTDKSSATGSGNSPWTITFTHTISWASTDAARYFFNAGGLIKIQFSKTSTGTDADPDWNTFINSVCGTLYVSGGATTQTIASTAYTGVTTIGGTGTPSTLVTNAGWYNLTTSQELVYQQFSPTAPYTGDYVAVSAQKDGTGTELILTTVWYSAGDPDPGADASISGGTDTTGISFGTAPATVVTYTPPSNTYLSQSPWGTPTVTASIS